jgi:choline transport protein
MVPLLILFSSSQMAEEIKNASTVVPKAIMISILLNGTLGFAMLIAYLFCMGDLEQVIESQATLDYPFLFVFQVGTGSTAGAATMALIVVALGVCSTVGVLASSSRMLWSFARDRGVPFARELTKASQFYLVPVSKYNGVLIIN